MILCPLCQCRYNPKAYEEYEKLSIPVLTDDDEWNEYHSVKKDPVLHVDVCLLCVDNP